jgi:hypothetical protein
MADFTPQQKAVLQSPARHNLVNAISKTGKTQLLIRLFRNCQEQPREFKAIFVTPNGFATQHVVEYLQRVTKQNWGGQLIGTLSEIGWKLVQKYYADLQYSKVPKLVSDTSVQEERLAALAVANKTIGSVPSDETRTEHMKQWNQDFVARMHKRDYASPRSLMIDAVTLFTKLAHHSLANVQLLVADDIHDLTLDEHLAVIALQERVERSCVTGNTNLACRDRYHDLDIDNWTSWVGRDGMKTFSLSTCFNMSAGHGTFLQQLAAFNSSKIYDVFPTFQNDPNQDSLFEVSVPSVEYMEEVIGEIENQLQLGIRNRVMGVVVRTRDEARMLARALNKPCCVMWDRHRLASSFDLAHKGTIITTPYEAPYLNLDYATIPKCIKDYWPYSDEKAENARHQFLRAVCSARLGVHFLTPDISSGNLISQFMTEGCNPKHALKSAQFTPAGGA